MDQAVTNAIANSMKAMGACNPQNNAAYTLDELRQQVGTMDLGTMYQSFQIGVVEQLRHDAKEGHKRFLKERTSDLVTVRQILKDNNLTLSNQNLDSLLSQITMSSVDRTVDTIVLAGIIGGLEEQVDSGMDIKTAQGVMNHFRQMILEHHKPIAQMHLGNSYYNLDDLPALLTLGNLQDTTAMTAKILGDAQQAQTMLQQAIDIDAAFLANNDELTARIKNARDVRNRLLNAGAKPDTQFRVTDLFAALSDSSSQSQILAFYENRAREQNALQADDSVLAPDDPTRIGNVIGDNGRDCTEKALNTNLSEATGTKADIKEAKKGKKAHEYRHLPSEVKKFAKGGAKKGSARRKYRGFASLLAKIEKTVNAMYSVVQTVGYIEKFLVKKYGKDFKQEDDLKLEKLDNEVQENKLPWETNYQAMPDKYRDSMGQLNAAGAFYEDTKARMLADKMHLIAIETDLQRAEDTGNTVNVEELNAKAEYYQARIAYAQSSLENLDSKNDLAKLVPAYYQQQTDTILNVGMTPLDPSNPMAAPSFIDQKPIQDLITIDRSLTAKDHLKQSLIMFAQQRQAGATNAYAKDASRAMAATLMGVSFVNNARNEAAEKQNEQRIDVLADPINGVLSTINLQMWRSALDRVPGRPGAMAAEDFYASMDNLTVRALQQNEQLFHTQYTQYQLNKQTASDLEKI